MSKKIPTNIEILKHLERLAEGQLEHGEYSKARDMLMICELFEEWMFD